jgi:hypothetical protein
MSMISTKIFSPMYTRSPIFLDKTKMAALLPRENPAAPPQGSRATLFPLAHARGRLKYQ